MPGCHQKRQSAVSAGYSGRPDEADTEILLSILVTDSEIIEREIRNRIELATFVFMKIIKVLRNNEKYLETK